jgi:hypothetical protein
VLSHQGDGDWGDKHLSVALEEEEAVAVLVDGVERDENGHDVHGAHDDGRVERRVLAKPDGVEEDMYVEHDDFDARDLLEERDGHSHYELRAVACIPKKKLKKIWKHFGT